MWVYCDTRIGKNGNPHKTNISIQFWHEQGRDIDAPDQVRQCLTPA